MIVICFNWVTSEGNEEKEVFTAGDLRCIADEMDKHDKSPDEFRESRLYVGNLFCLSPDHPDALLDFCILHLKDE